MISFKILGKFTHQWKDVKKHKFSAYNFMVLNYPREDRREKPFSCFLVNNHPKKRFGKRVPVVVLKGTLVHARSMH